MSFREPLSESHIRHLMSNFQYADRLLSDVEAVLTAASSKSPFPKYIADITPAQRKVVEDYIARIRSQLVRVLASFDVHPPDSQFGSIHAIRVNLSFVRIAIQESAPKYLVGYGPVPESLIPELSGLTSELEGLVNKLDAFLAQGPGRDIEERLARLAGTGDEVELLKKLDSVISRHSLVEYRTALAGIVDRLATTRFEIAVFGLVSSGKSSLLNHILGPDILPVGVNPITAVPTHIVYATEPGLSVLFVDRTAKRLPLTGLADYVTEDRNPANHKGVIKIVAEVPAPRLKEGVVFVDTPGLGSLATAGAAETKNYLPQCDMGIVLVNAGATIGQEDIATVQALYIAGVPPTVLLSKSDLLAPEDREKACTYIQSKLMSELSVHLHVYPVSVMPGYDHLLDQWFVNQVVPLFAEGRRLARESISRKIGVLRESVEAALAAKLQAVHGASPVNREQLEKADQRLRRAAGILPDLLKECLDASDQFRELAPWALTAAASRLIGGWDGGVEVDTTAAIRSAIAELISAETAPIASAIERAAEQLRDAIAETAAVLDLRDTPGEHEFKAAFREMPRIELGGIALDMKAPITARLGRKIGLYFVERRLRNPIGGQIETACTMYGRVLQVWVRDTVGGLTRVFDARADAFRAQLDRLLAGRSGPAADDAVIERDLRELSEPQLSHAQESR